MKSRRDITLLFSDRNAEKVGFCCCKAGRHASWQANKLLQLLGIGVMEYLSNVVMSNKEIAGSYHEQRRMIVL